MADSTDKGNVSILKLVGVVAILILAGWFIFSNVQTVSIRMWVGTVSIPMWVALLLTFLLGWGVGLLVGAWRRRRR